MRKLAKLGLIVATGMMAVGLAACGAADTTADTAAGTTAATTAEPQLQLASAQTLSSLGVVEADDKTASQPDGVEERIKQWAAMSPAEVEAQLKDWHFPPISIPRPTWHVETVVQVTNGPVTLRVHRGEIVAVDDKSVTVKSPDGYTQTYSFAEDLKVVDAVRAQSEKLLSLKEVEELARKQREISRQDLAVGNIVGLGAMEKDGKMNAGRIFVVAYK